MARGFAMSNCRRSTAACSWAALCSRKNGTTIATIPVEADPRPRRKRAYTRVDWRWARNTTGTQATNLANSHGISMGWKTEAGWEPHGLGRL